MVVARVGVLINKTFSPATAVISEGVKVDYQDSNDFDHDGLTNAEEAALGTDPYNSDTDGDGYLDGEEVFSSHDPLRANDDSLARTKEFLSLSSTQRLAYLITGGLLSGELKRNGDPKIYAQSIDSTANATVYSILSSLEDVNVGDEIKNPVADTREAKEGYLKIIFETISGSITDMILNQPKEIVLLFTPDQSVIKGNQIYDDQQKERIKSKFLEYAVKFQQAYDAMDNSPVPKSWGDIHKKILTTLKKSELYNRSIALSSDDPLKQTLILANLQHVYLEGQSILKDLDIKIKKDNLTPPDSDFFDISKIINQ